MIVFSFLIVISVLFYFGIGQRMFLENLDEFSDFDEVEIIEDVTLFYNAADSELNSFDSATKIYSGGVYKNSLGEVKKGNALIIINKSLNNYEYIQLDDEFSGVAWGSSNENVGASITLITGIFCNDMFYEITRNDAGSPSNNNPGSASLSSKDLQFKIQEDRIIATSFSNRASGEAPHIDNPCNNEINPALIIRYKINAFTGGGGATATYALTDMELKESTTIKYKYDSGTNTCIATTIFSSSDYLTIEDCEVNIVIDPIINDTDPDDNATDTNATTTCYKQSTIIQQAVAGGDINCETTATCDSTTYTTKQACIDALPEDDEETNFFLYYLIGGIVLIIIFIIIVVIFSTRKK